jgi:hypothetical protein
LPEAAFCDLGKEGYHHLFKVGVIVVSKCPQPPDFYHFMMHVTDFKTHDRPQISVGLPRVIDVGLVTSQKKTL